MFHPVLPQTIPACPAFVLAILCVVDAVSQVQQITHAPLAEISVEEFSRLSTTDQRDRLLAALMMRLEHAKNLRYSSVTRLENRSYKDGKIGGDVIFAHRDDFQRWQLGGSYRVDTQRYLNADDDNPTQFVSSSFNVDEGIGRGTVHGANPRERWDGRIDTVHDPLTKSDRYGYWLDGEHCADGDYLIRYLIDHQESWSIEAPVEDDMVKLTVPWRPWGFEQGDGTREFVLDPSRDFLPVKGKAYFEWKAPEGQLIWRREEFFVEESRLVGDVWMPTRLREVLGSSSGGPNMVSVWTTEIEKIEHGTVTPQDLVVEFPKGTEVVDAINGTHYIVGKDGEPIDGTVESLIGNAAITAAPQPAAEAPEQQGMSLWLGIILVNVGALTVAVCLIIIARRRRAKAGKAG